MAAYTGGVFEISKVPSTHQVLSNATMDFSFSLFGKLEFAPLIVTSFILILLFTI